MHRFLNDPLKIFREDKGKAYVSISVSEKSRNKGIGAKALVEAIEILIGEKYNVSQIVAYIKANNVSSISFFEKCGFILHETSEIKGCNSHIYIYNAKK